MIGVDGPPCTTPEDYHWVRQRVSGGVPGARPWKRTCLRE